MKIKINYLILDKSKIITLILLFFVGVFLFPKTAYLSNIDPEKIIELTNIERQNNGLLSLTANQYLTKAAHDKAIDIFINQKFEHNINGKKFSSWIKETDYKYRYVGENLAIDFVSSEGVLAAWKDSPSHYKNIINEKFREIGVAVIEDIFEGENSILVVQIFGTPKESLDRINIDNEIISKNTTKNENSNIKYLTHSNNYNLEIPIQKEYFLDKTITPANIIENNNTNSKTLDMFFALISFLYLGAFKLVSFRI